MSFSINKAILLGNVTRDPELRYTKSGTAVMTINLATNHSIKQGDGSFTDIPTFHRVIVFGRITEWLSKNIFKGTKLYVDGRISTREYEDKNGQKQRSREIIAENVVPMSTQQAKIYGKDNATAGQAGQEIPKTGEDTTKTEGGQKMDETVNPEDIPF